MNFVKVLIPPCGGVREISMSTFLKFMTRARWEGLVILLVACAYLWELTNIPSFFEMPGIPGPMAFPRLLGVVFGVAGLWLLFSKGEGSAPKRPVAVLEKGQKGEGEVQPALWQRLVKDGRFYAMWVVTLGYLILWPILGFPIATFILLVIFFYLMDETRWPVIIGLSLVSTITIYIIFAKGLNVKLGLGLLGSVF
jgi:hypothetical protein